MNRIWGSIIIPTIENNPLTLKSLPDEARLRELGLELIVVKDRGWGNGSKTRNIGAAVAKGDIFCFIDDDAAFYFDDLFQALVSIKNSTDRVFYWADAPHILIVNRECFFLVGGYDERHPKRGAEAVEIRERLKFFGLSLRILNIELKHLRNTWSRNHYLSTNKSLTWTYLQYKTYPIRSVLWRKNPIELLRRWFWVFEWFLFIRWRRRSFFS